MEQTILLKSHRHLLPHLGERIVKTALAVFVSLIICWLRGMKGQEMSTEAAITALLCIQPYVTETRRSALNRFLGTVIGAACGFLNLYLLIAFPVFRRVPALAYGLMAVGTMLAIYSTVAFRRPEASGLAAIVQLCLVVAFPEIEDPLGDTLAKIVDVLIGTAIAISVNALRLPRGRDPKKLFFVRSKDLVPDRYTQVPSTVMFLLKKLLQDGARIVLMSEHAPAFFTGQVGTLRLNAPMIVMDGAGIFDVNQNRFLWKATISNKAAAELRRSLDGRKLSYFVYTIHHQKVCIFHHGAMREPELAVYQLLRRSPYRSYLEGEVFDEAEIVYFKIFFESSRREELPPELDELCAQHGIRAVCREEPNIPGVSALYLYSRGSGLERAKQELQALLPQEEPLRPVSLSLSEGYRSEQDAIRLLHEMERQYEPIRLLPKAGKKKKA